MSYLEGVSVEAWRGREWKRDIPWLQEGATADNSVRISEAELLAVVEQWLNQTSPATIAASPEKLVSDWLQSLQNLLGCQGLGLFLQNEDDWQAIVRHGGRSLGRPPVEWLSQVLSTGEPQGRLNDPAEGWGQLAFPLRCPLLSSDSRSTDAGVIVFSARHPESLDISATEELVLLLERLSQHAREQAETVQLANREADHARDLARLLASPSIAELLRAFRHALERTAPGWSSRFVLIPTESTTVLTTTVPTTTDQDTLTAAAEVNSGDAIACFHTEAPTHASVLTALLPDADAHSLNAVLCLPFAKTADMQGGCLIWPEEPSNAFTDNVQPDTTWKEQLGHLVRTCGQRWQELLWTELKPQSGQVQLTRDDALAAEFCRATLPAVVTLPAGGQHSLLLAGQPGSPLIAAVQFVLETAEVKAPARLLHCRTVTTDQLQSKLAGFFPKASPEDSGPPPGSAECLHTFGVARHTLILHEVDQLPRMSQQLLLNVLRQASENRRFRLICTTYDDLQLAVSRGEFLEDLVPLLGTMRLHLSPLRSQPELSLRLFQQAIQETGHLKPVDLEEDAVAWLNEYRWPGELDELRQAARHLQQTLQSKASISRHDLTLLFEQEPCSAEEMPAGLAEATVEFQRLHIRRAIARAGGNMTEAARLLDLHRSNLYRKMNQLNMAEAGGADDS